MHGETHIRFTQISTLIKVRPVETGFFHEDAQADMTKLIVAFRDFAKALKESFHFIVTLVTRRA